MLIMGVPTISGAVAVFALDQARFGLGTEGIVCVVRAVEVTPLAEAAPGVMGVINLHGRIIPVVDIRPRFGLPSREIRLSDHFVIARAGESEVAILVDAALEVISAGSATDTVAVEALAGMSDVERVLVQEGEIVPVHDPGRFMPAEPRKAGELKLVA
jgi:purine-binding chemotaxis protein CheW